MAIEIGKIRNVGVVGHGGVGKTSLVESLLFTAGAVNRLGKVDDGTMTTDFDPDEIKRKISVNTALAYCDWKGHRLNLVDTPGYGDFIADARAGLRVVEAAVVVVEAAAETDDDLTAKYLEEGSLDETEMLKALRAGITQGKVIPVLCAAATKGIGSVALLDLIVHEFPSPADRADVPGTDLKTKQS